MNKTVAFIVVGAIAVVGLAGYVLLIWSERDAGDYAQTLLTLLGLAIAAGGLGAGLQKIEKQTNGTLSRLIARNQELEAENTELRSLYAVDTGRVSTVPRAEQHTEQHTEQQGG